MKIFKTNNLHQTNQIYQESESIKRFVLGIVKHQTNQIYQESESYRRVQYLRAKHQTNQIYQESESSINAFVYASKHQTNQIYQESESDMLNFRLFSRYFQGFYDIIEMKNRRNLWKILPYSRMKKEKIFIFQTSICYLVTLDQEKQHY